MKKFIILALLSLAIFSCKKVEVQHFPNQEADVHFKINCTDSLEKTVTYGCNGNLKAITIRGGMDKIIKLECYKVYKCTFVVECKQGICNELVITEGDKLRNRFTNGCPRTVIGYKDFDVHI